MRIRGLLGRECCDDDSGTPSDCIGNLTIPYVLDPVPTAQITNVYPWPLPRIGEANPAFSQQIRLEVTELNPWLGFDSFQMNYPSASVPFRVSWIAPTWTGQWRSHRTAYPDQLHGTIQLGDVAAFRIVKPEASQTITIQWILNDVIVRQEIPPFSVNQCNNNIQIVMPRLQNVPDPEPFRTRFFTIEELEIE